MQRWLLSLAAVAAPGAALADKPDLDKLLEKKTFTQGKSSLPYRLLRPATAEKGSLYPLVVFLHGAGERGDDNKAQLRHGVADFAAPSRSKANPCFLIAPQCPKDSGWASRRKSAKGREAQGDLVVALIEQACKELPIDKKRIYLTGLSMGGYGTWDLAARHPELFAAGMPICGGGDPKSAARLAKLPLWVFHGDADTAVKVERSRDMIEAIKQAGGSPKYTEYKGVGHDSWTRSYGDPKVLDWLFAQKRD